MGRPWLFQSSRSLKFESEHTSGAAYVVPSVLRFIISLRPRKAALTPMTTQLRSARHATKRTARTRRKESSSGKLATSGTNSLSATCPFPGKSSGPSPSRSNAWRRRMTSLRSQSRTRATFSVNRAPPLHPGSISTTRSYGTSSFTR